jgi:hypothetical protein
VQEEDEDFEESGEGRELAKGPVVTPNAAEYQNGRSQKKGRDNHDFDELHHGSASFALFLGHFQFTRAMLSATIIAQPLP